MLRSAAHGCLTGGKARPSLTHNQESSDEIGAQRYLADPTPAAIVAAQLDEDVDHARGIGDRVAAGEADAGLHHHQRQLLERAAQRVGVDGGEAARMAGVDRAQEADAFGAAQFAQHNPVGAWASGTRRS